MSDVVIKHKSVYIQPVAMRKIEYYTAAAHGEVSGLGILELDKDGDLIIQEVFLLEQESSSADTELDGEAISKLMHQLITEGKDPSQLKFWWHSHSNMGVFWSGTDHACAEVLSKEYAISMVVNKKNQKLARLDIYSPIRITVDNIAINELADEDEELKKQCEAEVREKVRPGRIVYAGGFRGGYYNPNQAHALGYSPRRQHKQPDDGYFDQDGHWIDDWNDSYAQAAGAQNDKQSTIKPILIEDIERMETLSQQYGVLNKITWMVYIRETFLDILRTRYEVFGHRPKVNCALIGTYSDTMNACKACPSIELCQRMTTMIQETNEVIKQEKDRLEQSKQPASHK